MTSWPGPPRIPRRRPRRRLEGRVPHMTRILVADSLDPSGLERLTAAGAEVVQLEDADRGRLAEILPEFDALLVRSATKVTAALLAAGDRLKVVGRAGI